MRVQIASLPWGTLVNAATGRPAAEVKPTFSGTIYAAQTGGTVIAPSAWVSNRDGVLPGWVEPGRYTFTDPDGDTFQVDVISAATLKGVVVHNADANVVRPIGYASIEWIGTVEPVNAIDGDTWVRPL